MLHKVIRKQNNSDRCIICGEKNPFSMNARFYELDNNELVGIFKTKDLQQSFPGRVHGGMIVAMLDETIGRALWIDQPGTWAVTVELNVKYKKSIPTNATVKAIGRITKDSRKLFEGTGEVVLEDGQVAAEAWAKYMKVPLDQATDDEFVESQWFYLKEDDPTELDI